MLNRILPSLLLGVAFLAGCQNAEQPRLRISSYFGSVGSMKFPDAADLGKHNYGTQWNETNGMVYTCRGGFIDLGHLREAADRTYYVTNLIHEHVMNGESEMTFRVIEPSEYRLVLNYPSDWQSTPAPQRQQIARDVAAKLGQDIAHTSLVWHEIITWYGFSSTGLFSEQISSFSWEDTYSDVLGTVLATEAMKQNRPFDDAMTDLIYKKLKELDVQSPAVAQKAYKQIEGRWFEGGFYFFVKMNKRNFDIGLNNGQVVPWLVPDICSAERPAACPVPRPQSADVHGFGWELTLNPMVHEKNKIYRALAFDKKQWLTPARDFPLLLDSIVEEAREQYGAQVDVPLSRHLVLRSKASGPDAETIVK